MFGGVVAVLAVASLHAILLAAAIVVCVAALAILILFVIGRNSGAPAR